MEPPNPDYAADVAGSFARQGAMQQIGARLVKVAPGLVEIALEAHPGISQQMGSVHGGIVTTIADSAAGYAAMTLRPKGVEVVTIDLSISFLKPARGSLLARGTVVRSGRSVSFTRLEVFADGTSEPVAIGTMTVMPVPSA